jgi:hypothetical protein
MADFIREIVGIIKEVLISSIEIPFSFWLGFPWWVRYICYTILVLFTILIGFAVYKNKNEWMKVYH